MLQMFVRNRALRMLKNKLKENNFEFWETNPNDPEVRLGAEIAVIVDDPTNSGIKRSVDEIKIINDEVAEAFNLTAIGRGPVWSENALAITYCGFRR